MNNTFNYEYSAKNANEIEKIRKKYSPAEKTELDRMKELDRKIESAGIVESLIIGIVGCLIFGLGLCFALDALIGHIVLPFILCPIGILVMIPAYPIYLSIQRKARELFAPEILSLADSISNKSDK